MFVMFSLFVFSLQQQQQQTQPNIHNKLGEKWLSVGSQSFI